MKNENYFLNLCIRVYDLIIKLTGSRKSIAWVISTILMFQEKIPPLFWAIFTAGYISFTFLDKFISIIKINKEEK